LDSPLSIVELPVKGACTKNSEENKKSFQEKALECIPGMGAAFKDYLDVLNLSTYKQPNIVDYQTRG
jgi:hypothetical protein